MSLIPDKVLNGGVDLKTSDTVNAIISMNQTVSRADPKQITSFEVGVMSLHTAQEKYLKQAQAIKGDKTLNKDQQGFLLGELGEKYQNSTKTILDELESLTTNQTKHHTSKLYMNSYGFNDNQRAILNSGVITDKVMNEPIQSAKNDILAPMVALFSQSGMYEPETTKMVQEKLNNERTPEHVAQIQNNERKMARLAAAREGITTQVRYISPAPEKMAEYRASKALKDLNKKMGIA